jgi:GNAT superfamily N-acetyltransferase
MMEWLIRPAAREDLRETVLIYLDCLRSDYACKPKAYLDAKNVEDELKECEEWMVQGSPLNRIFVAMDSSTMAGYIAVGPNVGSPYDQDGEVCGFFVRKSYRKMGAGIRLLKTGVSCLQDLGFHQVVIYNYHESEANGFYRRLGGEVVHQEIQHPGGLPLETDVFRYDIAALLDTLEQRISKTHTH